MVTTRKRKPVSYNDSDTDFESDQGMRSKPTASTKETPSKKTPPKKTPAKKTPAKKKKLTDKEPLPESDDDDFEKVSKDKSSDKAPAVKRGKKAKREETPETKEKTPESKETTPESRETTPESRETTPESEEDEVYGASATLKSSLVIPHPKGSPFPDAISPSTLEFMAGLAVNNDRDYMRLHAKEWIDVKKDFIDFCGLIMTELNQADPSVLVEDAKNAMYRQHRDLRFSNDKRPYKTYLSGSFSAEGRKFERAGYFISLEPGNKSMVAAGVWQPDKYKLQRMRDNIIRHGDLLREALSTDAIIEEFDGESGVDILEKSDMLKVAPKGIERDHPEIELLRYRSFAVRKNFTDEEVVSAGFLDKVMDTYEALIPFIALINSWL